MILIPEQISRLREQREKLLESRASYEDYMRGKEIVSSDGVPRLQIGDPFTDNQIQRESRELQEITDILTEGEYLRERQFDKVGIGTKFVIQFDGIDETETVILADCVYGLAAEKGIVSTTSILGKEVLGKTAGSTFDYVVQLGDKRTISGTIIDIISDPKAYAHFLTRRPKDDRTSKPVKRKLRELSSSTTEEARQELASYLAITASQKFMLQIEEERLLRKKDPISLRRLATVRKLLASPVETDTPDGIITVGSKFDLAITGPDQEKTTHTYEMINNAVSDELEDAYVERISPLGNSIYGLRKGDAFRFRRNNKTYIGQVLFVHPQKNSNEYQPAYQYTKR